MYTYIVYVPSPHLCRAGLDPTAITMNFEIFFYFIELIQEV